MLFYVKSDHSWLKWDSFLLSALWRHICLICPQDQRFGGGVNMWKWFDSAQTGCNLPFHGKTNMCCLHDSGIQTSQNPPRKDPMFASTTFSWCCRLFYTFDCSLWLLILLPTHMQTARANVDRSLTRNVAGAAWEPFQRHKKRHFV